MRVWRDVGTQLLSYWQPCEAGRQYVVGREMYECSKFQYGNEYDRTRQHVLRDFLDAGEHMRTDERRVSWQG